MTTRVVMRLLTMLAAALAVSTPAWAQQGSMAFTGAVLHLDGETSAAGFGLDVAGRVAKSASGIELHVVGDVASNHFSASTDFDASTTTTFMAGVRFTGRASPTTSVFAQFMAGAVTCCGATDRAAAVGGGFDVRFPNTRANFRLQVDVPVEYYPAGVDADGVRYDAGSTAGFRLRIGVSINLGR